ncbi:MAG TPA: DUF4337 family protein, partial [Acetobacteraceae bacterium]|nr:DUF4337 family protein [Acetobacteraceae bacterium]
PWTPPARDPRVEPGAPVCKTLRAGAEGWMSETIEHAREGIEHADHAHPEGDHSARWIAVLVAVLAAALAICELGEKSSMTAFLNHHIALSDDYAYYQEKHVRLTTRQAEEDVLLSLPDAASPAIQERLKASRQEQARLQDNPKNGQGMKQLQEQAERDKEARDHAAHLAHQLEISVGGLQIAIVLASVSIVTRVRALAWCGGALGAAMAVYAGLLWTGAV